MSNPHPLPGPGRPKGAKNRSTLLKEERRAIFDEKVSQKWEETIDKLPPTYIADQFLGKAPEEVNLKGKIEVNTLPEEIIAQAEELLRQKKLNE